MGEQNGGQNGSPKGVPNNNLRGVKIRNFNYAMVAVAVVLYGILLYLTVQVFARYETMTAATEDYIRCEEDAAMVEKGSDDLTAAVRLYVVTGEMRWAEAYFEEANVNRGRDRGLEDLEQFHPDDEIQKYLKAALGYSNDLMEREIYAMALVAHALGEDSGKLPAEMQAVALKAEDLALDPGGALARASDMVFGDGYQDAKMLIMNNIDFCLNSTLRDLENDHLNSTAELHTAITQQRLCVTVLFVMNVMVFVFVAMLIIRPLHVYIQNIKDNKVLEVTGAYEFKYLALTYNSIFELNATNEEVLRKQAEHDALTGLLNRGAFDRLQESLRDRPGPMTLTIIDVDRFKEINDTYGHAVGDQVLIKVAGMLTSSFRSGDFVARMGGDEFCVVMTGDSPELQDTVRRKIEELNEMLRARGDGLPAITLSAGVAGSQTGLNNALGRRADKALYASKTRGRAQCTLYSELNDEEKDST